MADADLRDAPPEFHARIRRLIDAYHPHLREARIQVQVRDSVRFGTNHTSAWATVDTPNNDGDKRKFDFTMWYALEAWANLTDLQRDALMDHELTHCIWDEKGEPSLYPHTIEEFDTILVRYGVWWPDAQGFIDAINNMPAPREPEGVTEMPLGYGGYHRPMRGGSSGSSGAGGSSGSSGAGGSSGSSGAGGSSGSSGARIGYTDPALRPGDDFYEIPLMDGEVLILCPDCYQAVVDFVLANQGSAMPQQGGSSGSSGA